MKTKTLRVPAVCLAVGAGLWSWWLLGMQADGSRGAVKAPAASPPQHQAANREGPVPVQWPEYGSTAFKRQAQERSAGWLNARGRDAAGLIAIWDLTGDEALLKEAAEKFPNDPRVCMAMISRLQGKSAEALPWVERLIAEEPKNPAGHQLKAWALRGQRDAAGALAALTEAGKCSGVRNDHAAERAGTVREAALAAGMSPAVAARVALGGVFDRMLDCRVGGSVNRIILDETAEARKAGDEARLMETTGLGLTMAESMTRGTVTGERFAAELQVKLLTDLPDDTGIGAGGRSVSSLRAEMETRQLHVMQAHRHGSDAAERLRTESEEWVVSYADCFLGHGEVTAMLSMLDLPEPEEEEKR